MLRIRIVHAKAGMELGLPVFHPELPGHVLLRPGFKLDEPALARLMELRVKELWVRASAMKMIEPLFSPEIVQEQAHLARLLGGALDDAREPVFGEGDLRQYTASIRNILDKLAHEPRAAILIGDVVAAERAFVRHALGTCFLSLLLGIKLEPYLIEQRRRVAPEQARALDNLGIAGLMCDIGILKLPHEVVERYKATGDESDPKFQAHVQIGYELLRGRVESTAAVTVLQHHQRFDGWGYPRVRAGRVPTGEPDGLTGEGIHVFARIVSVADQYERLRNPSRAGESADARQPAVRCLKQLLIASRKKHIDPVVFKALLHVAPAYAPGSLVQISDGRWCVVVEHDPMHPCRPLLREVRIVAGEPDYQAAPGGWIDLQSRRELFVVKSEGHEVAQDNFESWNTSEFDLRVTRSVGTWAHAGV
jgi:HD-GYP domain-containing protein (c-di-GMP phosphodiesterase class II)